MPGKQLQPQGKERKFWKINNLASGTAEIFIYEQIGWDWWTWEGIEAKDLCKEIAALNVQNIDVHILCPGGSVFDGIAIYNALKRHSAFVTTYNDGLAASIASVIFCAGDKRVTSPGALFMIHLPTTDCINGDAEEMRKTADLLDTVRDSIVGIYRTVTTMTDEEIIAAMEAETYYSGDETTALGFASEQTDQLQIAAKAKNFNFRALGYHRKPAFPEAVVPVPAKPANSVTVEITTDDEEAAEDQACYCTGCVPEMPCVDCTVMDTCINPNKTTSAVVEDIKPQGANFQEVTVMSQAAAAPATGARNFSQEATEIVTMCLNSGCPDKANEFISAQLTPDQAGKKILDLFHSGAIATPAAEAGPIVDLGKDAAKYSYTKAINLMYNSIVNKQKPTGLEFEVHQDLVKNAGHSFAEKEGSILIPHRVANRGNARINDVVARATMALRSGNTGEALRVLNTALTTGGVTTGAETVFQEYGEFIDILRNMMVTTRMGARVLTGLKGPINFPKQTGSSTLYWTGENPGGDVTPSNVTFGTVTMTPKTCQAQGAISRQLIVESTPDTEGLVRVDLAQIHALGWDQASMHGTGQNNQPTGLYNLAGVNAKAMGGIPTYELLVEMITAIATYNSLIGSTGWVTNPLMAGRLMTTLDFPGTAGARPIWQGKHIEGTVAGYDAIASNQVKANLGAGQDEIGMLFGNWDDLMIGMWGALELLVDPYTLAGQGLLKITSFQMIDIAARRGESFSKSTGATITPAQP